MLDGAMQAARDARHPNEVGRLEMNDAAPDTDRHGLRPIPRTQFFQNMAEVRFDGIFGDGKPSPDIPVTTSVGDLSQNLYFALAQDVTTNMLREILRYL